MRLVDALAGELHLLDGSLRSGQTGDGHTEGRAGHIVQTGAVAELHGGGIAAVLAADTQMQVGVHAARASSNSIPASLRSMTGGLFFPPRHVKLKGKQR